LNAKKADYHAVIIYNSDNSYDSSEIKDLKINAFFINHSDAQLLKHSAYSSNLCVHVLDESYDKTIVINLMMLIIILLIIYALKLALYSYLFYKRRKDNVNEFKDNNDLFKFIFLALWVLSIFLKFPLDVYKDFFNSSKYDLCK
jgi:hypothetical protein